MAENRSSTAGVRPAKVRVELHLPPDLFLLLKQEAARDLRASHSDVAERIFRAHWSNADPGPNQS